MSPLDAQLTILGPPLLAGILVLATHVPLGREVLKKGIIFIDLAIAQVAGLGVIVAHRLGLEPHGWGVQPWAVGAALLAALLLYGLERWWPEAQEALIGALFVVAACAGILLLANSPQAGEHLKELLVGQILWVSPRGLIPVAVLSAGVVAAWFSLRRRLGPLGFYLLFAVTVTASVQVVGVYLVFASLILPALAAQGLGPRSFLVLGYGVGVAGYAAGLLLSALTDLPAGPLVVCALAGIAGIAIAGRRWRRGASAAWAVPL